MKVDSDSVLRKVLTSLVVLPGSLRHLLRSRKHSLLLAVESLSASVPRTVPILVPMQQQLLPLPQHQTEPAMMVACLLL